jgi:AcrR family transcriptional regulator
MINVEQTKKRPYHHGDLRDALLRAGEQALETGGAQNLSLRELGRELGVSHTAFRRHFVDRQALLDGLALEGFERLHGTLNKAVADRNQDFEARLIKLARAYVRFSTKHPALTALMFAAKHNPAAPPELIEASERTFAIGPLIVEEGQAAGEVVQGDSLLLTLAASSSVEGLVAMSRNGKFKGILLDRLVGEVIQRIVLGLRPRD